MQFFPSVIIKRITLFSCTGLRFEMYACFIPSLSFGENKIFTTIVLLFISNFFQSLASAQIYFFPFIMVYEGFNICYSLQIYSIIFMV